MKTHIMIEEQLRYLKEQFESDIESIIDKKDLTPEELRKSFDKLIECRLEEISAMLWAVAHNRYDPKVHHEYPKEGILNVIKRTVFGDSIDPVLCLGIGAVIVKDKKILLGKRVTELGHGHYAVPGGRVEFNESLPGATEREVLEETGMRISVRAFDEVRDEWYVANHVMKVGEVARQYIGCFMVCDWIEGDPQILEPEKIEAWNWYTYDEVLEKCRPNCHWLPLDFFYHYGDKIMQSPQTKMLNL